ncbi:unnamed protein product [Effrenium voratum]|nr:unnamed protein product [Effrenium voratum]
MQQCRDGKRRLEVCHLRGLNDCVLYVCEMLLELLCGCPEEKTLFHDDETHLTCIAIFSIAVKVCGNSAGGQPASLRCLAKHLGHEKFSHHDIVNSELKVLQALEFQFPQHTRLDFLDGFLHFLERQNQNDMQPVTCVASFLQHLALGDAALLNKYPYAVLAAGAVYVALWATEAGPERYCCLLTNAFAAVQPANGEGDAFGGGRMSIVHDEV